MTVLSNLTDRQKTIADILWHCNSRAQVDRFIRSLPTKELQQEANNIVSLIILSTIDDTCNEQDDMKDAQDLINKIKRG